VLRLAYETSKLVRIPVIRKVKETAPRQGFFELEQFETVRRRLRPDLQTALAIEKAGMPGRLRRDLRRTAARNMVNLGVPERVAMKVTGHKARSVFDRYHIVSPGDLQDVARRPAGTFQGTPRHSEVAARPLNSDNPSTRP